MNLPRLRFDRVLDRLDAADEPPPTLRELAQLAECSPWHFHRQFRALTGLAVQDYARQHRLVRAAARLAFREASVGEIAGDAGYANAESFARAFRRGTGQSPSEFRDAPDFAVLDAAAQISTFARSRLVTHAFRDDEVRFETVPDRRIALLMHRGDPARLGESLRRFIGWRRAHRLPPPRSATFNLLYDDPASVPPDDWRFGLACECNDEIAPNAEGLEAARLAGGRHAVLPIRGGDDVLEAALAFLYGEWLPRSGEAPADAPLFLQRLSFFPDVPEREALSEIWLPLQGEPSEIAIPQSASKPSAKTAPDS